MFDFLKGKRVVVTGGSGFLGTHFLMELVETGAYIRTHTHNSSLQYEHNHIQVFRDIDLMKLDDCIKLTEGADYVIHCAGEVAHPSSVPTDVQISLKQLNLIPSYKFGIFLQKR